MSPAPPPHTHTHVAWWSLLRTEGPIMEMARMEPFPVAECDGVSVSTMSPSVPGPFLLSQARASGHMLTAEGTGRRPSPWRARAVPGAPVCRHASTLVLGRQTGHPDVMCCGCRGPSSLGLPGGFLNQPSVLRSSPARGTHPLASPR